MIKLRQLLTEAHLEDLFHATQEDKLLKILKDNAIKLAFVGGTEADQQLNKGYPFFLSTMRARYGNYVLKGIEPGSNTIYTSTIIHLDGRKLTAAGFKVFPVDFWQQGPMHSEQEERIVSNKDEITPLSSFVKAIYVYINTKHSNPFVMERFHAISDLAKTSPVPIYFFLPGNEGAFKAHRIEKAVRTLDNILPQPEWSKEDLEQKKWKDDYDAQYNPGNTRYERDTQKLRIFLDIYYGKDVDTKTYPGRNVMEWLLYHPYDAQSQIACDIHNLKSQHPPIFREFVSVMKKEKFKTVKEFVSFMIDREQKKEKIRRDKEADEKGWRR